jgi:hypothetical protein
MSAHYVITLKVTRVEKPAAAPAGTYSTRGATSVPEPARVIEEVTQFTATRTTLAGAVRLVTGHLELLAEDGGEG